MDPSVNNVETVSGREAAELLASHGLSLAAAQRLLRTGIAGPPSITRSAHRYDRARVSLLAESRPVAPGEVRTLCPRGYLVVRLPTLRTYHVDDDWPAREKVVRGPWRVGQRTLFVVAARQHQRKALPLVLTASGFVVGGAEVIGICGGGEVDARRTVVFDVAPPGDWLETFRVRPCAAGRGPQMLLRGWP